MMTKASTRKKSATTKRTKRPQRASTGENAPPSTRQGPSATSRLNLATSQQTRERLERLLTTADAETYSEVVRRALVVYEAVLEARKRGDRIIMEPTTGDIRRELIAL
jgi:hypothetical protein